MSVETIFAAASQKPAAERAAYLTEACGDDAVLLRKVERLLKAHDAAGGFLEEAAAPDRTSAFTPTMHSVEKAYRAAGAKDKLEIHIAAGISHKVTADQHKACTNFMQKWLRSAR